MTQFLMSRKLANEVLLWVDQGLSNDQIRGRLHVMYPKMFKEHMDRYIKLARANEMNVPVTKLPPVEESREFTTFQKFKLWKAEIFGEDKPKMPTFSPKLVPVKRKNDHSTT